MTSLKSVLEQEVAGWEHLGHPALLQRFVLRNGQAIQMRPQALPGRYRRGTIKGCFKNAFDLALRFRDLTYVEGLAFSSKPFMPIHHAWCIDKHHRVVDNTWEDPERCQYLGVPFDREFLSETVLNQGFYGLLDTGRGLNHELMFKMDPELEVIVSRVREKGVLDRIQAQSSTRQE